MKEVISRLENWLRNNCPQVLETLNPGASKDEFEELESMIGLKLPQDFIDFYSIHNGQAYTHLTLFSGDALMSIEDIIVTHNQWKEVIPIIDEQCQKDYGERALSSPEKGIKDDWWNEAWIPITSNGCGDNYCIDLSPTSDGQLGQIIRMWHDDPVREVVAKSFKDWLYQYVEDLENNKYEFSDSIGWGGLMKIDRYNRVH